MDRRRPKILIASFIVGTIVVILLLFWGFMSLKRATALDMYHALGTFSSVEKLNEATVINGFEAPVNQEKVAEGQRLAAKYGYQLERTRQQKSIWRFILYTMSVLVLAVLFWLLLLCKSLQDNRRIKKEMAELNEQIQEELRRNSVLLQRKYKEDGHVKSVITDIAHQLKTPVASLKMSMEIAASGDFTLEERSRFITQGVAQVDRLDLMLDSLANLSHLETGLIDLDMKPYSFQQLITEVVNSLIMKAVAKDIEIEVVLTEDQQIMADRKWTIEAIGNILENAIKYSPKETTIQVIGTYLPSYVLVEVRDEGVGIPEEEINLIYQRFYRGSATEILEKEGSGVGLYLARKIIEEQGGVILTKNRQPKGTKVQLTIPLTE
ncbi:sensor histidine kinase [Enterococcus sp. LJL51]|uniref:sensor histidine kinase n=1 Tax=Enterococcus sp. LJL51 TaxID=3416656 RepID=UPI003CF5A52F